LATDGTFSLIGWFFTFPKIDLNALEHLFRHRVLHLLLPERRIDEIVIRKLRTWVVVSKDGPGLRLLDANGKRIWSQP
jgi:hypothetical protein